jgi:penicillin-binding protein 1A
MAYAHEGVELKPIQGFGAAPAGRVAQAEAKQEGAPERGRPSILTGRGTGALLRIERLLDDAARSLAASSEPSKTTDAQGVATERQEALATNPERRVPTATGGNLSR